MNVKSLNNFLIFGILSTPLASLSNVVSGIDLKYQLDRFSQKKEFATSSGIKSYQKVLSKSLGSHCSLYPHDSKYAQINFQKC
ncbi:MAG: hypothetical protein HON90_17520, partial [Halobacteriovoraceae bacterium]|nr:hypothetical protein [Halobacteriovoraceae bacterium]